jgi:hypothetical protein
MLDSIHSLRDSVKSYTLRYGGKPLAIWLAYPSGEEDGILLVQIISIPAFADPLLYKNITQLWNVIQTQLLKLAVLSHMHSYTSTLLYPSLHQLIQAHDQMYKEM